MTHRFILGDCVSIPLADKSVDLVMCSPPYEAARTYAIGFALRGQEWVDWAMPRYLECLRVYKGLVCWVAEGQTRQYRYIAAPILLMADLHRKGVHLRKPPIYVRHGIPGSGGPDWLANKYEFCICATNGGKLPWSDNTACGHPSRYGVGGRMSNRHSDGRRTNEHLRDPRTSYGYTDRRPSGELVSRTYTTPALANPGNLIDCGAVGGGNIGSDLAHENEAPYPEKLAEFFVKSFCPPGGTVLDVFSGSGTTVAVAAKLGRVGIGMDIRPCQIELGKRRLVEAVGDEGLAAVAAMEGRAA